VTPACRFATLPSDARFTLRRFGRAAPRRERGLSLVELIVAISIVAIGVTAVLGAHAAIATRSADAMVRQQAVAIAESYLEEILLKPFADPDGVEGETARSGWDDVDDYNGLDDNGIRDQNGTAIAALSAYRATVTVQSTTALTGIASSAARRVDVTVTGPQNVRVALTGYRTAW
jgi:MSHA pilin protein MshD